MSRRYPVAELYEERERDFYRSGPRRSTREYEELDVDITRSSQPDFMREDYARSAAGPLVVAERREVEIDLDRPRSVAPVRTRPREIEKEEISITREERDERPRRRARSVSRAEFSVSHSHSDLDRPRVRKVEKEETDITIRREEREERIRPRPREVEREEVTIRRTETEKPAPRPREIEREEIYIRRGEGERRPAPTVVEREEITIRRDESRRPPPRREVEKEEITIRHGGSSSARGRNRSVSRERITIREKSRGPPPREPSVSPVLVARETEEFVIRRRRPPSPSPPPPRRKVETDTIVIKRTERSPTPPPAPPPPEPELPPPPPVVQPIYRPPIHQEIHQEIITHHRHIDHGVERAQSPIPPPPAREPSPPPREKVESLEIDIRRRDGGRTFEEEIIIDRTESRGREKYHEIARPRSLSPPRRTYYDDDLEEEAEYYNRKAMERAYPGEAFNGATKDWAIIDVPPGTERVEMRGAGGGAQEISWQRYNGVRRSKFKTGDREFDTGFGAPAPAPAPPPVVVEDRRVAVVVPPRQRPADMWTEITKDLVLKEAVDEMGYQYEETEYFFYVMEYMRYEDVLQLVEISDEIRAARRRRIREIEWEREDPRLRPGTIEDRYYEREIIVDSSGSRRRH